MIKVKRGLDLPISGAPEQVVGKSSKVRTVAVLGRDFVSMKPTMIVKEGDSVKLGQALFSDKKNPAVIYTSPAAGKVSAINRGKQRVLLSVVVDVDGDEAVEFPVTKRDDFGSLERASIVKNLIDSGMWVALRTRPYSKVPDPEAKPHSLYVNAMDTNPLAADPNVVIKPHLEDFVAGVNLLAKLPENKLYLCIDGADRLALQQQSFADNVQIETFGGVHPAGLSGTHMHFTKPVSAQRAHWSINYQDVIAIARLFTDGKLFVERVLSFAGPQVEEPRLIKARLGANLDELTAGELNSGENRIISGSVLGGRTARGAEAYLGRYHFQITVLREGRERPLFGYLSPGVNRHSVLGIYVSSLFRRKKIPMATSTQGSDRAMVPVGSYEKVMPLDILPTQLLRALIVGDIETAQNLGALELDEEDLALCSYVCPGKYEYGAILRENLTRLENEG